ncbi:MAG: lysylphosphatidylglycerol synthase domain-containing protein [Boseongicola sp.]|nr:lysylphosphatidylglycerol synthase domain-containing protein [Boseongicola sp.]MDD9978748.1 lysylphosphatidylglycerol synthase domain-containing protein [Boseongicola sp.]
MKQALRIAGTTLALVFLGYVVWRGVDSMPPITFSGSGLFSLAAALVLYTLSQLVAAGSWTATLRAWNIVLPIGRSVCHVLLSQIGKYLPGNVAQFIGRFALARADGIPSTIIGAAILAETGLLIGAGVLIVAGVALLAPELLGVLLEPIEETPLGNAVWAIPALGLAAVAGVVGYLQLRLRKNGSPPMNFAWLGVPVMAHAVNFVVLGLSLVFVVDVVSPAHSIGLGYATIVFVVAWVAGFIVPGAPGGIGIRDGIIVIGLGLVIGDGAGLTVALLHRAISILGDALTFAFGWMVRSLTPAPAEAS